MYSQSNPKVELDTFEDDIITVLYNIIITST